MGTTGSGDKSKSVRKYRGVRKASDSSIAVDFIYRGVRCREVIKLEPTAANLSKAEKHRADIVRAIELGTFDYSVTFPNSKRRFEFTSQQGTTETVGEYLHRWFDALTGLKASTLDDYGKTVRLLAAEFEGIELRALTRPRIKQWFEDYEATPKRLRNIQFVAQDAVDKEILATPKRLRNIQSVLRNALADAVDKGLLESNPLFEPLRFQNRVSNAPLEDEQEFERLDPFSAEEQKAILDVLTGQERNLVQFAFWTGMRTSELAALRWRDISLDANTVSVRRVKTQRSDKPERPKTAAGRRTFKLLRFAREALLQQMQYTYDSTNLDVDVFNNPATNQAWTGDQPIRKRLWVPALKRAGVRYRYPYQTRHTFASMAFAADEDERYVCQALGHRDIGTTRRHYTRWIKVKGDNHGEKMEALFGNEAIDGDNADVRILSDSPRKPA